MNESENPTKSTDLTTLICRELLKLARREEELAADELAQVPYWMPTPASVLGHRAAASALRADLARFERSQQAMPAAS